MTAEALHVAAAGDQREGGVEDAEDPAGGEPLSRQDVLEGGGRDDEGEVGLMHAAGDQGEDDGDDIVAVQAGLEGADDELAGRWVRGPQSVGCPGGDAGRQGRAGWLAGVEQHVTGAVEQDDVAVHDGRAAGQAVEGGQVAAGEFVGGGEGAQEDLGLGKFAVYQTVEGAGGFAKGGVGFGAVCLVVAPDQQGGDRQAGDEEDQGQAEEARADGAAEDED